MRAPAVLDLVLGIASDMEDDVCGRGAAPPDGADLRLDRTKVQVAIGM